MLIVTRSRLGARCPRGLRRRVLFLMAISLALMACSGPDRDAGQGGRPGEAPDAGTEMPDAAGDTGTNRDSAPSSTASSDAAAGDSTVGGDGSQIVLAPLGAADIEAAALGGELACSFALAGDAPLLLAMGDVASADPARGLVKVGSYVEPVAAPGGFDAMLDGARFTGAGKTVDIAVTGPAIGGGESPARPATLTYHRADGARRQFVGRWQCGP